MFLQVRKSSRLFGWGLLNTINLNWVKFSFGPRVYIDNYQFSNPKKRIRSMSKLKLFKLLLLECRIYSI